MASIVYKPHCSKCGAVIHEEVAYRDIVTGTQSYRNLLQKTTEIFPIRCERCKQLFDKIEIRMPEQLPTEYLK